LLYNWAPAPSAENNVAKTSNDFFINDLFAAVFVMLVLKGKAVILATESTMRKLTLIKSTRFH
jgi:hypothetical protein